MSVLTEHDLGRLMIAIGLMNNQGQLIPSAAGVNLAAATQTLTAAQSGQVFVGAVDAVFTLPASSAANKGIFYTFVTGALSSGTGLSVSPAAADAIFGAGLTAVVNKDLINTGATDVLNDSATIVCTGQTGVGAWQITNLRGIWSKEA